MKKPTHPPTLRGTTLAVLAVITLAVAVLSARVNWTILVPAFGGWAIPTVAALDTVWAILLLVEYAAGNNLARKRPVQIAGLVLTVIVAAIPAVELIASGGGGLAIVMAPLAIAVVKAVWVLVLPGLGRKVSPQTKSLLAERRQTVDDRLEVLEADASHRLELLTVEAKLTEKIAKAETKYRKAVLKAQADSTETLHTQAIATDKVVAEKPLPPAVGSIALPVLGEWEAVRTGPVALLAGVAAAKPSVGAPSVGSRSASPQVATTEGVAAATTEDTPRHVAEEGRLKGSAPKFTDEELYLSGRRVFTEMAPPKSLNGFINALKGQGVSAGYERAARLYAQLQEEFGGVDASTE
ncbi:hypothetical protein C9F11_08870 [Streptomyces sp. YIM 121038]|uniref:hypothetical protein n=1 Tax=Streptomyces sp. YIM 121038 TaxID=2136401 RepID=UPI0011102A14|nr:hypothetical protein [Streptomyces sp. YIM 121038]QCX75463.1 hypothetical protein C9F11_08870 [Streptomyces sp. YIM 121038]